MSPPQLQTTSGALPSTPFLALYHRWKWLILLVYASFYLFQYLGRFHLSQVAALVMQDLAIDHRPIGWITALLYWGFMAGDLVHGRLGEIYGQRLWVMLGAVLTTVCNWLASMSTSAFTLALPIGYVLAPLCAGVISDRLLHSARRPMVLLSAAVSALGLVSIALLPPTHVYAGATLLFMSSFAMSLSPMAALAVDIAGRHMAGTASGILDAHGYFYAGLQAIVFGVLLNMSGSSWPLVFFLMAGSRVLCGVLICFVRV